MYKFKCIDMHIDHSGDDYYLGNVNVKFVFHDKSKNRMLDVTLNQLESLVNKWVEKDTEF